MRTALAAIALLVAASPAFAAETLPAGVVGCISQKNAMQYADYVKTAPDFAEDMLQRASCYINKEPVEVVRLGGSKGYLQFQLLSGHRIWVPSEALTAAKTGNSKAR